MLMSTTLFLVTATLAPIILKYVRHSTKANANPYTKVKIQRVYVPLEGIVKMLPLKSLPCIHIIGVRERRVGVREGCTVQPEIFED